MTIAIDIRPLLEPRGGIREYTARVLSGLLALESDHSFVLFSSGGRRPDLSFLGSLLLRATHVHCQIPNRVLNASILLRDQPTIDGMIRKKTGLLPDVFFSPNINFCSLSRSVKRVTTLHDLSFEMMRGLLSRKSALWHGLVHPRRLYEASDLLIAVSEASRRDATAVYGLPPDRIRVTHLSCAESYFSHVSLESRSAYGLPESYFFAFGGGERKNIRALIDAYVWALGRRERRSFPSLLIGGMEPSHMRAVRRHARLAGIEEKVVCAGPIPSLYLRAYYVYALAFVYPSITEGFGIPPLEAAACGTPVIASAAGSIPEVMGSSALLINPYRIEEIARALTMLADNPDLREHYRVCGRTRASRFSWRVCAEQTLSVLESV